MTITHRLKLIPANITWKFKAFKGFIRFFRDIRRYPRLIKERDGVYAEYLKSHRENNKGIETYILQGRSEELNKLVKKYG